MILGIGAVCLTVVLAAFDIRKKKKQQQRQTKTIRLCITGGPCGGKTQGINMLYNTLKQITVPVFIVPEAATIIGSAGFTLDLSKCDPRQIQLFQIYLMRLQFNLENIICNIAKNVQKMNKKTVVLCDRGMLDGKAYAGDQNWNKMLQQVNITQEFIIKRYQAIVHMVTAAEGASDYYMGNTVRHEDIGFAIQLDRKIQNCYRKHSNRFIITNEFIVQNFEDKKKVLLVQVYQIILKITQENKLIDYYQDYIRKMRKSSEDDVFPTESPYMIRKKKNKAFIKKENRRIGSPKRHRENIPQE